MTRSPMTRQEVPPLLSLSGAVLEAQWDRVGHITLSDRCRRAVGEKKRKNRDVSFLGHAPYVAPYDKILIVCASFIFDLDTPFDSAHRDLSYEAISTSI